LFLAKKWKQKTDSILFLVSGLVQQALKFNGSKQKNMKIKIIPLKPVLNEVNVSQFR